MQEPMVSRGWPSACPRHVAELWASVGPAVLNPLSLHLPLASRIEPKFQPGGRWGWDQTLHQLALSLGLDVESSFPP